MAETTTSSLAESIAEVAVLRAVFLDRPLLGGISRECAAEQRLTAILDDTVGDLRVRALAASALMEPSWFRFKGSVVSPERQVRKRARAVLREALEEFSHLDS